MNIRFAKKEDSDELLRLTKAMTDYHHQLDRYYKPSSAFSISEEDVVNWLNDANVLVLVAEESDKVIGYLRGSVENAPAYVVERKIGIVDDVFVEESFRQTGIAGQLFSKAKEWFLKKKIQHLELNVDARNAAGISFWRKQGFSDYKLRMKTDLQ